MIANSLNGIQRLNELKEELLLVRGEQNRLELKLMIADVAMMTDFGDSKPAKSTKPVRQPPKSITPKISQEEYIDYLESQNEAKISDDDWKWFYMSETCTTDEAAELLIEEPHTIRRQAGDKIRGFQSGERKPWTLYRGSVLCAKYEITDAN